MNESELKDLLKDAKDWARFAIRIDANEVDYFTMQLANFAQRWLVKANEQERQFICRKCGLREELGTKTEPTF